jgi:hypothetical protein
MKEQHAKKKCKGDLYQRKSACRMKSNNESVKKAEDNADLDEHEKRISRQLLTENNLEEND